MIDFMLLGAPRSGTAWASVWLTTATSTCLHDPLWDHYYKDLDKIPKEGKRLGVACTGLAVFPQWLNAHPAPKVILHRDPHERAASMRRQGIPTPDAGLLANLDKIQGIHVPWTWLFTDPDPIYRHLLQEPYDVERHRQLSDLKITSRWEIRQSKANPNVVQRYAKDGIILKVL